jgi:hypothetical protein
MKFHFISVICFRLNPNAVLIWLTSKNLTKSIYSMTLINPGYTSCQPIFNGAQIQSSLATAWDFYACAWQKVHNRCWLRYQFYHFISWPNVGHRFIASRVTRWVCEKFSQNVAQSMFYQNWYITITVGKVAKKLSFLSFSKKRPKETKSKPSPDRKKIAQFGHPDREWRECSKASAQKVASYNEVLDKSPQHSFDGHGKN